LQDTQAIGTADVMMVHVELGQVFYTPSPGQLHETASPLVVEKEKPRYSIGLQMHMNIAGAQFSVEETCLVQARDFHTQGAQHSPSLAGMPGSGQGNHTGPIQIIGHGNPWQGLGDDKGQAFDTAAQNHGRGGKAGGLQGVGAPIGAIGAIAPEQGLDALVPSSREENLGEEVGRRGGLCNQGGMGTACALPARRTPFFQQQGEGLIERKQIEAL
jgi:hypothetical protein